MRVLLVTDNRFWRNSMGSHRRVLTLVQHLNRQHQLEVLFTGYLYPSDQESLARLGGGLKLKARGQRQQPLPPTGGAGEQAGLRHRIRRARRVVRQVWLEAVRGSWRGGGPRRRFSLQVQEPKLADYMDDGVRVLFEQACSSLRPEVVVIEYVRLAWLLQGSETLPALRALKFIDTHDVQHERQTRFHATGEPHDIDITPQEEARALRAADVVIAIQPTDADKLHRLVPDRKVIVVGVPSEVIAQLPPQSEVLRIGFFGSGMLPNVRAARRLAEKIFPSLRERFGPDVELHLFGTVCKAVADLAGYPGVTLRGFVDDLATAYAELEIVANPIDVGGGLKIKNVEALCYGMALLTTSLGAEGLEELAGSAFIVADDDAAFVESIASLVANRGALRSLRARALASARTRYEADSIFFALDELLARRSRRRSEAKHVEPAGRWWLE